MTQAQNPYARSIGDKQAEINSDDYWNVLSAHYLNKALEGERRVADGFARESGPPATIDQEKLTARQEQAASYIATQQAPALVEQAMQFLSEQK